MLYTARVILPTFYKKLGAKELGELVLFYDNVKDYLCSSIIKSAINHNASNFKINHLKDGKKNRFMILEVNFKTIQDCVTFYNEYAYLIGK